MRLPLFLSFDQRAFLTTEELHDADSSTSRDARELKGALPKSTHAQIPRTKHQISNRSLA